MRKNILVPEWYLVDILAPKTVFLRIIVLLIQQLCEFAGFELVVWYVRPNPGRPLQLLCKLDVSMMLAVMCF